MRFLFIIVTNIILFINCFGIQFNEGKQYTCLSKEVNDVPQLLEFFSFYCPHCYQFEEVFCISRNINRMLPKGINIVKYHVDFLGKLGKELTQAWAVAIVLGIEDEISSLIFSELYNKKSIHTIKDIRLVFIKFGLTDEEYDLVWNGIKVKSLMLKQKRAASDFRLSGVPVIFVNGRYMVKNDGLDMSSMDAYVKNFFDVIYILIFKI